MPTSADHAHVTLPLVDLVRRVVGDSGLSLREFASQRKFPYSTLRYYNATNRPAFKQPPRPQVLRDLARALQVPLSEVENAADRSIARVRQNEEPSLASIAPSLSLEDAIRRDPTLLPEARSHLLNQVQLLRRLGAADEAAEQRRQEAVAQEVVDRARLDDLARAELDDIAEQTQSDNPPIRLHPGRGIGPVR